MAFTNQELTVADGQTTSNAGVLINSTEFGLAVPSTFDGTTITFTVSELFAGTYQPLYDASNTQVSRTVAASRSYPLPAELKAWPFFKIVCGTAQTGATIFDLVGK